MTWIDEPLLEEIEAELGDDGVWVAPGLRNQVSPAQEARIEAAVVDAPTPTYVTLVQLGPDDPLTGGNPSRLPAIIRDDTGWSGTYVLPDHDYGDGTHRLELVSYPSDHGLYAVSAVAAAEHPDDLYAQTMRALELLESGDAERVYDEMRDAGADMGTGTGTGTPSTSTASDDDAGGVVGLAVALLVVAVAVFAGVRRLRSRGARPLPAGAAFTLPPAVLSTVRAAEDRRNEDRAQRDVLALGEAIDAAHLDPRRTASLPAWQAALDHYDVARRILDRDHSPADAIGAIVLAERGGSALEAARRGSGWSPSPGCYFHPLHEGPVAVTPWRDGEVTTRVPACAACTRALEEDREPDDILDFVAQGRPAHYFRLDLGPWSRTGYGSLDPDLLGRLLDRR